MLRSIKPFGTLRKALTDCRCQHRVFGDTSNPFVGPRYSVFALEEHFCFAATGYRECRGPVKGGAGFDRELS